MLNALTRFIGDEEGAAGIEYVLIGALVSVAGIVSLILAGDAMDRLLVEITFFMGPD